MEIMVHKISGRRVEQAIFFNVIISNSLKNGVGGKEMFSETFPIIRKTILFNEYITKLEFQWDDMFSDYFDHLVDKHPSFIKCGLRSARSLLYTKCCH